MTFDKKLSSDLVGTKNITLRSFKSTDRERDAKKNSDYQCRMHVIQEKLKKNSSTASCLRVFESFDSDLKSIVILLVLYIVQGVPMGLSASIPFLLQGRVSYNELGTFSLVSLPFSLKVLWAPVVDSLHVSVIGRRKSWLIPVQLLCSGVMYYGATFVDIWMGSSAIRPNVKNLLIFFGILYFLMATQDVAVDGWSLTMLSDKNRAFSSTCNTIGQLLGFSIAHVGFIALQDTETCNKWLRPIPKNEGIVTLGSFLQIWATIILMTTIVICFVSEKDVEESLKTKSKKDEKEIKELKLTVGETYKVLFRLITFNPVFKLSLILLTCRFAFGPIDAATDIKLVEAGMKKAELAFFAPFMLPVSIMSPMLVNRFTKRDRPLRWFIRGWVLRQVMSIIWIGALLITRSVRANDKSAPIWLYVFLYIISLTHNVTVDFMFSSQMTFFARISDPIIGGTYMTLLNTISNLGSKWPNTLSLMTLDMFTNNILDGFILQTVTFGMLGLIWLHICLPLIKKLESEKSETWRIAKHKEF